MTIEIYVLAPRRELDLAMNFFKAFAVSGELNTEDLSIPFLEEAEKIFSDWTDLLEYLIVQREQIYHISWSLGEGEKFRLVSIFFTEDGNMGFGFNVADIPSPDFYSKLFMELKNKFGCLNGYITWEEPPPYDRGEFFQILDQIADGCMKEGQVIVAEV